MAKSLSFDIHNHAWISESHLFTADDLGKDLSLRKFVSSLMKMDSSTPQNFKQVKNIIYINDST